MGSLAAGTEDATSRPSADLTTRPGRGPPALPTHSDLVGSPASASGLPHARLTMTRRRKTELSEPHSQVKLESEKTANPHLAFILTSALNREKIDMIDRAVRQRVRTLGYASAILAGVLASGFTDAATTTFSYSGPPVPIPDGGSEQPGPQVAALIVVSGVALPVAKIVVSIDGTQCNTDSGSTTVGIDHSFVGDLVLTLRSPVLTQVKIIDEVGASGHNFCQVVLDDAAVMSIQNALPGDPPAGEAPFTGTWRPESALSAFNGQTANGTWSLLAQDEEVGGTGSIRAWSIIITDAPIPPPIPPTATALPIPTLSAWAKIMLALLVLVAAGWYSRKQQG